MSNHLNNSKLGCVVLDLSRLFERYKAVTPQEQNNVLREALASVNKQGNWPKDGVSYDCMIGYISGLGNQPFGHLKDLKGPHQTILIIGSLENIQKIKWNDSGFANSFQHSMKDYPKDNFKGWLVYGTTNLSASIALRKANPDVKE